MVNKNILNQKVNMVKIKKKILKILNAIWNY